METLVKDQVGRGEGKAGEERSVWGREQEKEKGQREEQLAGRGFDETSAAAEHSPWGIRKCCCQNQRKGCTERIGTHAESWEND